MRTGSKYPWGKRRCTSGKSVRYACCTGILKNNVSFGKQCIPGYAGTARFRTENMVLATFEGIDTLEAAVALRDKVLYAKREDLPLPEGSHFVADLLGLPVIDADTGEKCGVLEDVTFPGAHPVYVVRDGDGTFMIPAVPAFIMDISFGQEKPEGIYVHLIEGMREV